APGEARRGEPHRRARAGRAAHARRRRRPPRGRGVPLRAHGAPRRGADALRPAAPQERPGRHRPRRGAPALDIIHRFVKQIDEQRRHGRGRLGSSVSFAELAGKEPFLDGCVQVHPPAKGAEYEIIVLGDLHGCYTCLKAALLQSDFFGKVEAYQANPDKAPYPILVFLGDYIDRGLHSYDGILRTVLRLYLAAPPHVVVLRGNYEHYMERDGRVQSPVIPAEAIAGLAPVAPRELLLAHMH